MALGKKIEPLHPVEWNCFVDTVWVPTLHQGNTLVVRKRSYIFALRSFLMVDLTPIWIWKPSKCLILNSFTMNSEKLFHLVFPWMTLNANLKLGRHSAACGYNLFFFFKCHFLRITALLRNTYGISCLLDAITWRRRAETVQKGRWHLAKGWFQVSV